MYIRYQIQIIITVYCLFKPDLININENTVLQKTVRQITMFNNNAESQRLGIMQTICNI